MSHFQSGVRDGYIYGYIFYSKHVGLILDEGSNEYPIDSAELLIDGEFVLMENLTLESMRSKGLYSSQARIKQSFQTDREFVIHEKKRANSKKEMVLLTKEEYVLSRIEMVIKDCLKKGEKINPSTLLELTEQWKFDYEAEKAYRPHVLKK